METTTLQPTKYVDLPARAYAGLSGTYTFETIKDIPALWGRFAEEVIPNVRRDDRLSYGLCYEMGPEGIRYLAGVEISDPGEVPANLTTVQIPASHYAIFTYRGPISEFNVLVDEVWQQWLPASGLQVAEPPHMLERYDERFDTDSPTSEMELWLPLRP